ncbi:MAG: hypothetical protein AAF361_15950 [Bacteroidota bacterium]
MWYTYFSYLFIEHMLDKEEYDYKYRKAQTNPTETFVVLFVYCLVFSVGNYQSNSENDDEKECKNELPGGEHIVYFWQN